MKLWKAVFVATVLACTSAGQALGDELVQIVQQDLTTLGYDTGPADGEATTKTIIAVSKFQAEHNLEVTGEITPQLAGVIQAAISKQGNSTGSVQVAATAEVTPEQAQAFVRHALSFGQVLRAHPPQVQQAVAAELTELYARHYRPGDGVMMGYSIWLVSANA